jgi:hypothetical protein
VITGGIDATILAAAGAVFLITILGPCRALEPPGTDRMTPVVKKEGFPRD